MNIFDADFCLDYNYNCNIFLYMLYGGILLIYFQ